MNRKLLMLIPTRHRPQRAREAMRSAIQMKARPTTDVMVLVDGDESPLYREWPEVQSGDARMLNFGIHRGLVGTLNFFTKASALEGYSHVGFMGDDHRVRTGGYDAELVDSASSWGIAYGNDLNMGERLPTSVVISTDIVNELGYFAPPTLEHLFCDNYWRELGEGLGTLVYRSDVHIEHLHPTIAKSKWDEQYRRVNASDQFERDGKAWEAYRATELGAAIDKIKKARKR